MSSLTAMTPVFFTGATGYIGGACLTHLMRVEIFGITALVRNADKAKQLDALGVWTVVASLDDSETLVARAAEAEIVFHTVRYDLRRGT